MDVLHRLTRTLEKDKNYKVYFDNFVSSINLMLKLAKERFWTLATIHRDWLKGAKTALHTEKDLKKQVRCSVDYLVDANSGIAIVQWYDNNIIQLMSNYMTQKLGAATKRWCKKDKKFIFIDCPKIIEGYNKYMGGVDLCGMLFEVYLVRQRSEVLHAYILLLHWYMSY